LLNIVNKKYPDILGDELYKPYIRSQSHSINMFRDPSARIFGDFNTGQCQRRCRIFLKKKHSLFSRVQHSLPFRLHWRFACTSARSASAQQRRTVGTVSGNSRQSIAKLNAELKTTVARINQLRSDIDTIVSEIEGGDENDSSRL